MELEVNAHKSKYMTVSLDQNAGRIHSMKMDNSSIERVEKFKYLGTTSLSFLRACFPHSSLAPTHAHLLKHYTKHI